MRRTTVFAVAMAFTVASFCVLAKWIEPTANASVGQKASIDVHLKVRAEDLPILVVDGLI